MNDNDLTSKGASQLFKTLKDIDSIVSEIYLSYNRIDDDCMKDLGQYVQGNEHLKKLKLFGNRITDKGIEVLSDHLIGNTKLNHLWLRNNTGITDASAQCFIDMAMKSQITELNILETSISDEQSLKIQKAFNTPIPERPFFKGTISKPKNYANPMITPTSIAKIIADRAIGIARMGDKIVDDTQGNKEIVKSLAQGSANRALAMRASSDDALKPSAQKMDMSTKTNMETKSNPGPVTQNSQSSLMSSTSSTRSVIAPNYKPPPPPKKTHSSAVSIQASSAAITSTSLKYKPLAVADPARPKTVVLPAKFDDESQKKVIPPRPTAVQQAIAEQTSVPAPKPVPPRPKSYQTLNLSPTSPASSSPKLPTTSSNSTAYSSASTSTGSVASTSSFASASSVDVTLKISEIKPSKCILGEKIDEGSFGFVYKGEYSGHTVAIKRLKIQNPTEREWKIIRIEIELMRSVNNHPNIIKFLGACYDSAAKDAKGKELGISVILEYAERGSLHSALFKSQTQPDFKTRLNILCGVAQGLQFLHNQIPHPIAHRDLKPQNILLDYNWTPKLCDFGLSVTITSSLHLSKGFAGTCSYSSPEAIEGESQMADARALDVWAFGCIIYECITLEQVWDGLKEPQIRRKVCDKQEYPTISGSLPSNCPSSLVDLMNKCFKYEAKDRPTMDFIYSKLKEINPSSDVGDFREIHKDIKEIKQSTIDIKKDIEYIKSQLEASNKILASLVEGNNLCFKYFIVKHELRDRKVTTTKMIYLVPICEYGLHECKCGEDGNGYMIRDRDSFLNKNRALIQFGLSSLQLAASTFGAKVNLHDISNQLFEMYEGGKAMDFDFQGDQGKLAEIFGPKFRDLNETIMKIDPGKKTLKMGPISGQKSGEVGWVCDEHRESWRKER